MEMHWLVRPRTIRLLWTGFIIVLVLTVVAELFIDEPAHEGLAGTFGFGAWYGFAACTLLIIVAKGVGMLLKRPDNYYDAGDD